MDERQAYRLSNLKALYKYRIHLLVFVCLSAIAAGIFSAPKFIKPQFKSQAIIYPPGTNSNRMLIDRDARFGADKEIDEQIQLLRSAVVRDSLIEKYKLFEHYNIDTGLPDKRYRIIREFDENVNIDRTRFNSVAITVSDADPEVAASMANEIIRLGDRLRARIIKSKLQEAFNALAKSMFDISLEIDQLADEINQSQGNNAVSGSAFYKSNSIQQLKEQLDIKELMRRARDKNNARNLEKLYLYEAKIQQFSTLQMSYDQALVSLNNQIPTSFVISSAEVADKKYYPIRWLFVLIATLGSLLIGCVLIISLVTYKSFLNEIRN